MEVIKQEKISPYIVWGSCNAEGLCFYLVSYILFTGALGGHGACMVLLCCFGKAERVDFLMPWLPAAWQQEAPSDVSRESRSSPGLKASWNPAKARHCLVREQEDFHMSFQMGTQRRSISIAPDKSEQSSRAPATVFRAGWMSFLLNCWTTNSPPGQATVAGGTKGRRKSCSANKIPGGVRVWVVGAADLPNPLGFTPPSWAQLGNLAGFACPLPGKARLERLVSPTNPQLSNSLPWSEVQRNTQYWEIF